MQVGLNTENPTCREDIEALAAATGLPLMALHVLDKSSDPFLCGTESQRQQAEWFLAVYEKYRDPGTFHLRGLHYRMVSAHEPPQLLDGSPYLNTGKCFEDMRSASRYARHLGLVDAADFVDRRNPPPHIFADYKLPVGHDDNPHWSVDDMPAWELPKFIIPEPEPFSLPEISIGGYDYSLRDQPAHLEVWIEKSTMNDVLVPICRRLGINLVTGVGFQSITGVVQLLRRLNDLPDDRPTRIGYISDFDPAGDCMPVAVAREIEFYIHKFAPGRDIKLTPIALTREQVVQYNLVERHY
jgi:hypothetical protein